MTTDNAGNSHTSATITVRVDNTNPTGSITAPADAANVRNTVSLTSNSDRRGGSGRRDRPVPALADRRGHLDEPGRQLGHHGAGRRPVRPPRRHHRQRRQLAHLGDDHRPGRQHGADGDDGQPGSRSLRHVTLTSTTNDGGSGLASVTYQLSPANANTWTNQAASWNTTGSPDGLYDLRVIAVDNAGNSTTSAVVEDRRVDNNAPAIDITAPVGIVNASAADPFTITASSPDADLNAGRVLRVPDAGLRLADSRSAWIQPCPYSVSRAIPADGSWTLKVVATDNALNTTSDIETVSIDRTRPQTTVDSNPAVDHEPDRRHLHLQLK